LAHFYLKNDNARYQVTQSYLGEHIVNLNSVTTITIASRKANGH